MHFNIVDYIILAILTISAISGFKRGFFASLGRMASTIMAIAAAFYYGKEFFIYLNNRFQLVDAVAEYLNQKLPVLIMARDSAPLSFILSPEKVTELTPQLAQLLVEPAAYIILFFLFNIMLSIVFLSLNRLFSGRFLGGINRVSGLALLVLQSSLIITILLGIAMPPLEFAARLDIMGTSGLYYHLQDSCLVNYMTGWFDYLKNIIGNYA